HPPNQTLTRTPARMDRWSDPPHAWVPPSLSPQRWASATPSAWGWARDWPRDEGLEASTDAASEAGPVCPSMGRAPEVGRYRPRRRLPAIPMRSPQAAPAPGL